MGGNGRLATTVPTRLTPAEGRKFGLTVGTAFLVLGLYLFWRGRGVGAFSMGILGGLLILGGIVIPGSLGPLFRAWMALAKAISGFTTPVFMGIIYFVVITITGIILRLTGHNAIMRKKDAASYWIPRKADKKHYNPMERQF